jgi:hypothetical protein
MKTIYCVLIYVATSWQLFANDTITNQWGAISCDVQMSLQLVASENQVKTNEPIIVSIQIQNVSNEIVYFVETDVTKDYYFNITSPSGKDLSTKEPTLNDNPIESRSSHQLKPGEDCKFQFDLRSILGLRESGSYKIIAKRNMPFPYKHDCVVISNPLNIVVSN